MNPQPPSEKNEAEPLTVARVLQRLAAIAFVLLLAGYLIFNRSFAVLGFPPFYVGEIVLGLALFAALFDFKSVFIDPLKQSRPMQLVAAFACYGIIRIAVDAPTRGLDAARDGVICLYAIAAFLGPWLLSYGMPRDPSEAAARNLRLVLLPASLVAAVFAFGIVSGKMRAPSDVKVDFLAVSSAVALGCWGYTCVELFSRGHVMNLILLPKLLSAILVASMVCPVLFSLPTRALWPAPLVLFLVLLLSIGIKRLHILIAVISLVIVSCGIVALVAPKIPEAVREKFVALSDPEDSHFKTAEGQHAAHSIKWRIAFWSHCVDETLHRAPVFGLGFGTNLTDLMRDTRDWPLFEDSQNAAKYGAPNRHPHSAHVTVFTRLGAVGALLWLALLNVVALLGLQNARRAIARVEMRDGFLRRTLFWSETTILGTWSIYLLAMTFGVVLENPFGGIWFWTLTGIIANRPTKIRTSQPVF